MLLYLTLLRKLLVRQNSQLQWRSEEKSRIHRQPYSTPDLLSGVGCTYSVDLPNVVSAIVQ